jgi:DNA-binding LacI/PurR family transcriptional regulator
VLSGRAEQLRISAATQARVHEAVQELGYRPNASARAVGSGRFGSAALIQPFEGVYLPTGLLLGITDELQRNDMHLVVSEVRDAALKDTNYLPKVVREVAADGLLINMMTKIPPRLLETLHSLNTPAVWINKRQPNDAVHPDDLYAGRWATEHFIDWVTSASPLWWRLIYGALTCITASTTAVRVMKMQCKKRGYDHRSWHCPKCPTPWMKSGLMIV